MAEILVKFDEPITAPNKDQYFAQAVGKEVRGGLWEGWLEFMPTADDADTLESRRETTQPNRTNLEYWAQGLTKVYLEGALARAIAVAEKPQSSWVESEEFSALNSGTRMGPPRPRPAPVSPRPILDPFQVYAQGESVLRSELNALSRAHLEAIVNAFHLGPSDSKRDLRAAGTSALVDAIVDGVRSVR